VKYTHTCPKCRSTDAVRVPGRSGAYGSGNNISVGFSTFNAVLVTRYVCLARGFVEEWIDRPQHSTSRLPSSLRVPPLVTLPAEELALPDDPAELAPHAASSTNIPQDPANRVTARAFMVSSSAR
jgi:hypothetical protein